MAKTAGIGIVAAVIGVILTFLIADAISGPFFVETAGNDSPQELGVAPVAFFTVIGGLIGLGLAELCRRFLSNPAAAFLGICAVGLILYGIAPFAAGDEFSTGVWLNVMHLVAAVPIVGGLARELRATSD